MTSHGFIDFQPRCAVLARRGLSCAAWARAYTLVDVIGVMLLIGIVGLGTVASMSAVPTSRQHAAAKQIQQDLSFARERSMATGNRHWVVFSTSTQAYSILAEDPLNPGRAGAATMIDPATRSAFTIQLNLNHWTGVTLISAVFGSGSEVGFDWLGRPTQTNGTLLAANGIVTISGGHQVIVQQGTGVVTHDPP